MDISMDNISELLGNLSDEDFRSLKDAAQSLLGAAGEPQTDAQTGIDPQTLEKLGRVMRAMRQGSDTRSQLIGALKPYLSEPRRKRADDVMQMLRMLDVLPMLGQL